MTLFALVDLLPWVACIGSLLYFLVAIVKPAWFLGVAPEQPERQAEHKDVVAANEILGREDWRIGQHQR